MLYSHTLRDKGKALSLNTKYRKKLKQKTEIKIIEVEIEDTKISWWTIANQNGSITIIKIKGTMKCEKKIKLVLSSVWRR